VSGLEGAGLLEKVIDWWAKRSTADRLQHGIALVSALALILGFFACLQFGNTIAGDGRQRLAVSLTSFAVYSAAAVVGASLGFIFGLPRPYDQESSQVRQEVVTQSKPYFLSNSNLIKVSDWLTTIVVGLTLVNLRSFQPAVARLAETLSAPLGGEAHSSIVGVSLALIGLLVGFVCCYLWTAIQVRNLFEQVERERSRDNQ
jgi:hypothetical protein